jgi:preprotein translocase subunit YajC
MTHVFAAALLLQAAPAGGRSFTPFILQIAIIMAIFYFILIRPQQKQRKAHEERINNLKKGDEVVTAGGVVGRVIRIQEALVDGQPKRTATDRVTIESGESRLIVERGRIVSIGGGEGAGAAT